MDTYGLPVDVDPHTAMCAELAATWGHVLWLRARIREIEPDSLVWGLIEEHEKSATEFVGTDKKFGAVPSAWLELYRWERTHLRHLIKDAESIGVEKKRIELAEAMGQQIVSVLGGVLARLGLDAADPVVLGAIKAELSKAAGLPEAA